MYFLLSLLFFLCSCQINRSMLNLQFKGFIYPYTIYVLKVPKKYDTIIFESISSGQVLSHLTPSDKLHLQNYKHIQSFYFLPNFPPTQIIVKNNLFLIKSINTNISWTTTYLKEPHMHKFYSVNNITSVLRKEYAGFFHGRQQLTKFEKKYLFDACQLWRSWVFVRLEQTEEEFSVFLKKEPGSSSVKKFSFVREYFVSGEIKRIVVQKHDSELVLQFLVMAEKEFCLFRIQSNLNLVFQYCSAKEDAIKQYYSISLSQLVLFYQHNTTRGAYKADIISLEENKTICSIVFPNHSDQIYTIYKVVHNRIVACTLEQCYSYSFNCQSVTAVEQLMSKIISINYERIQHQYLEYVYSTLVIRTASEVIVFTECDDGSLYQQSINMCRKSPKATTWLQQKYSKLNCYECSRTPNCYFQQNKCQYQPEKQVKFFNESVYESKKDFVEHFSRYSAGITSSCEKHLACQLIKNTYQSSIKIQQSDELAIQSTCQIILSVSTESEYLIVLPDENKFDIQICSSDSKDSQFVCNIQDINISNTKSNSYKVYASNYILFLVSAKASGPNWNYSLSITNLYQQSLYNVTMIFIKFAVSIIISTIIVVLYALLRSRILARLAIWGWIQFRHFGKYPLTKSELNFKFEYFLKKGYVKQIPKSITSFLNNKEYQQCCFCLNEITFDKEIIQIFCRHQFHKSCLLEWFQLEPHSEKCPMCKREFNVYEIETFNNANHVFHRRGSVLSDTTEIGMVAMQ